MIKETKIVNNLIIALIQVFPIYVKVILNMTSGFYNKLNLFNNKPVFTLMRKSKDRS